MTTLIKLTLLACDFYPDERIALVNPAHIMQIFPGLKDDESTYVELTSGNIRAVKETPEEIADLIFKAEHPECKL